MKKFLDEDFLLSTPTAKKLYQDYAAKLPIIDYHCHINPEDIALNKKYSTITELWLGGDHYKWRQIRSNGTAEKYIAGEESSDYEKFYEWSKVLPKLIGNPLYHWSYLELKNYFECTDKLNEKTAERIFKHCNDKLQEDSMSVRSIIEKSKVEVIGTTDDPTDSLEYHKMIREDDTFKTKVLPSFRPDKAINIEKEDFRTYIKKLGTVAQIEINDITQLFEALHKRLDFFEEMGCKISDHGLDYMVCEEESLEGVDAIFKKALRGEVLTVLEIEKYKTSVLCFLGEAYHDRNWVMQIHFGCIRNNSMAKFESLGVDTGFDAINMRSEATRVGAFMNTLELKHKLPKTILYSLNPHDNEALITMMGCFQGEGVEGKIQHGSAWWFNDTKTGIIKQLTDLANLGILGNFVGMLTDSRSFLSYARHEYFRRILCNLIGEWAENGEVHNDLEDLGKIIEDICYYNAKAYFGF